MSGVVERAAACGILTALVLLASAGRGIQAADRQAEGQNPNGAILADFLSRVDAYAALHEKLEKTLAPLPKAATPEMIAAHQRGLERLIARERSGAKRGDIFTQPIRAYMRRQLSRVFRGPDGPSVRAAIRDEETRAVRLAINGRYPDGMPRSSMPPQILLVLPRLPEPLEYRFVGERLVLLDIHALTVADYMDDAFPR